MTSPENQLFEAIKKEDVVAFKRAVRRGAGVNARTAQGVTPLHGAALHGWLPEVRWLLKHGAGANARTTHRCICRSRHCVSEWIAPEKRRRTRHGETPLEWATMRRNNQAVAELLFPYTDDEAVLRATGWARWHLALARGDEKTAIALLEAVPDLESPDCKGLDIGWNRPLEVAARYGCALVIEYLLARGARLYHNEHHWCYTALHEAARYGRKDAARVLIAHGAPIDADPGDGLTPFNAAVLEGHLPVAALLLRHGAEVEVSHDGEYAIHFAAADNRVAMIRLLLRYGADVKARDFIGRTPLHYAARAGALKTMRVLLSSGAPVMARDETGMTPLQRAASRSQVQAIRLLLQCGTRSDAGDRALWAACLAPRIATWEARYEREQAGVMSRHPLYRGYGRDNDFIETVQLLLEYGFSPNVRGRKVVAKPAAGAARV